MNNEQTKETIAAALKDLCLTTPFDKISVTSLLSASHVGRTTFYYHFEDKYALVNWIFDTETTARKSAETEVMPRDIMETLYESRVFYTNIFNSSAAFNLHNKIRESCEGIHEARLREYLGKKRMDESDAYVLLHFFTNAVTYTIITWAQNGFPTNLDDFNDGFTTLHLDCLEFAVGLYAK